MTASQRVSEPAVLRGPAALAEATDAFDGPALALVDRAVGEGAAGSIALEYMRARGCFEDVRLVDGPATAEGLVDLAAAHPSVRLVVGVGGGCVIDQVKLLAALRRRADTERFLRVSQRAGWTSVRAEPQRDVALVVAPTTLGTGAEMSRVACLDGPDGKRLIEGALLCADVAVLDARMTTTLPGMLVMEGIFEAWSRLAGALAGAPSADPGEDKLALGAAARLTRLGCEARDALAAGRPPDEWLRGEVARLSALSHSPRLHLARPPFAYKTWFLATELAGHVGGRKVPALAAVLPAVWAEILAGSGALGDRRALLRTWEAVAGAMSGAPADDPVHGLLELLASWGIAAEAGSFDPEALARSALRRWGAGLPMLGAADGPLLRRIFDGSWRAGAHASALRVQAAI